MKISREGPPEKQERLPSSGLIQFREQSALILAPAATPIGSKLSNSPVIEFGGTTAFQIPSPRPAPAAAGSACVTVAAQQAAASSAGSHGREVRGSCMGRFQQ